MTTEILITPGVNRVIETAEKSLSDLVGQPIRLRANIDIGEMSRREFVKRDLRLRQAICEFLSITWDNIISKDRSADYVIGRQLYCVYARQYLKYSVVAIGSIIDRDHTTVVHSCNVIRDMLITRNERYTTLVELLNAKLQFGL